MVGVCSCLQCQKRTGSAFGVSAYFPKDSVEVVSGRFKTFERPGHSGGKSNIHFCPACGSSLFWEGPIFPEMRGVAVGCFADPSFPPPQGAFWDENRHPWVKFPPGVEANKTQPDLSSFSFQEPGTR